MAELLATGARAGQVCRISSEIKAGEDKAAVDAEEEEGQEGGLVLP